MKKKLIVPCIAGVLLLIDQLIKVCVITNVDKMTDIKIIEDFFYIVNVKNTGGAWSILSGNVPLLIIFTFLVLIVITWMIIKAKQIKNIEIIFYSILLGGILGNLIDRICRSYVIDYLDFYPFGYNFPVFNFADICIASSVILLILIELRGDKREFSS